MGAIELGQYLKRLREERGFSLRDVSSRSIESGWDSAWSISPAQLLQIERGKTKRPGLLRLSTLADIYGVNFENLALLLREASSPAVLRREENKILQTLLEINKWYEAARKKVRGRYRRRILPEGEIQTITALRKALADAMEKVGLFLVPASDGQPPIPFKFAEQRLAEVSPDGKTRRAVLRLLLSMKGSSLEDCAAAFLGVSSRRTVESKILHSLPGQARPARREEKPSVKLSPRETKGRGATRQKRNPGNGQT
jgi:transcriptional regulator with XRE-family HTH domain